MNEPKEPDLPPKGQFLVYQTEDGQVKIDVRLQGETAWLTQAHMMERDASTPTGLCQAGRATEPNPFRVDDVCFTIPQGSSFLATLGYMTESLWDSLTGARQARDLEQTIAGNGAEILET